MLLCGCGVGFSVQRQHVAKLPVLAERPGAEVPVTKWLVQDTIGGWADALHELVSAAVEGRRVAFDYSNIRPAGRRCEEERVVLQLRRDGRQWRVGLVVAWPARLVLHLRIGAQVSSRDYRDESQHCQDNVAALTTCQPHHCTLPH